MGVVVAGAVLGRAFLEDPVWCWLLRGPAREARLTGVFTTFAGSAARTPGARLLATPERTAAALGAVPEARGTGVGTRVVLPVLDQCDRDRLPAYLESSNPRNWSFYERLGFVRREALPVPRGCPVLMPMWREPR